MLIPLFMLLVMGRVNCDLKLSTNVIEMEVQRTKHFQVEVSNPLGNSSNKTLVLIAQHEDFMQITPKHLEIGFNAKVNNSTCNIKLFSLKAGKTGVAVIIASFLPEMICENDTFLIVKIYKSNLVEYLSKTLGWLYFLAWSLSFYPQIFSNFKRKSVVGLSFDFIVFSLFGYLMYNSFNLGMYFIPLIKEQYSLRHPGNINPVYQNDIFFSVHSMFATILAIFQCIKYERGNQRISTFAKIIIGINFVFTAIFVTLAVFHIILWLDVLYACSYIKLIVTVTKYVPQVYMNYKRKSTQGWSSGSVTLDFTGGILSILQMMLHGYNYSDWTIILENPTKFGLGVISTAFDVVFLVQHHILYRTAATEDEINVQGQFKTSTEGEYY